MDRIKEIDEILKETLLQKNEFFPYKIILKIVDLLSSSNSTEMLNYHYLLFKIKEDAILYLRIRSSFEERPKEIIEPFLLNKLDKEKNISLKADVIQLFGVIKSKKILPFIYKNITSPIRDIRYRCIIVLGWVGNSKDLSLLNERMINDSDEELREFGATAMRQIWFNHKKTSDDITKYINNAIRNENSEKALIGMIITLQDLYRKKFGIKESQEGDLSGDAIAAKAKAIKYLDTIFK